MSIEPEPSDGARADGAGSREGTTNEQWFRSLFTRTTSAITRLDVGGRVIECNSAVPGLTGRSEAEISRSGLSVLFAPDAWTLVEAGFALADERDGYVVETSIVHADGHEVAVMVGVTPADVDGAIAGHFVIIRNMTAQRQALDSLHDTLRELREVRDNLELQVQARTQELKSANSVLKRQIAERERAEDTIRWQAYHDSLTQLPNRMMFQQQLGKVIECARRNGERIAVMFVDLDRFKNVNDTLGHAVGDELLRKVSDRFQSCLDDDMLLSRMGGDEFTVVIPHLDQARSANDVAKQLLATLNRPFILSGNEVYICGSVGISIYPDNGSDCQSLLQYADIAMYSVKGSGGGAIKQYSHSMDLRMEDRVALETALRRGLDHDELVLHFQSQVDLTTLQVVGVEALVRWNHPQLGLLRPKKFIPIAEETGLILRLGEWVMLRACRQAREWELRGHPMRVAVNVFARQFEHAGLVGRVAQILDETGLSANLLDLELTESAMIRNCESVRETLEALRAIGVKSSLDDFGTGYSSLSYLRRLPINMLKIDRSFIHELAADNLTVGGDAVTDNLIMPARAEDISTEAKIIRALIEVAHALNLVTIAEGVETEFQRQTLLHLGCDLMQGFLFSKPLPAAELEELLGFAPAKVGRAA